MRIKSGGLLDCADKLERVCRELDRASSDIASASRRLGESSGMEAVRRRLLLLCGELDSSGLFAHKQGQTLIRAAQWYDICETRIQDEYEGAIVRFQRRENAMIDVSLVSSILQ